MPFFLVKENEHTACPFAFRKKNKGTAVLFCFEIVVDFCNQHVGVGSVNRACHFDALSAGGGAAEAVHADFKEEFCGFSVKIKDVADDGVFCNFHTKLLLSCVARQYKIRFCFCIDTENNTITSLFYHIQMTVSIYFLVMRQFLCRFCPLSTKICEKSTNKSMKIL